MDDLRTIQVRDEGAARFVRLHRPEADNAINQTMVTELTRALDAASADPGTVVLVLEGLPEVFCVGADLGVISEAARAGEPTAADPALVFDLFDRLSTGAFFSVAHVRGRANAGGVGLVAASDVVIADTTASFGLSELLFGLLPAAVLPFLVRRVGLQRARYLAATTQTVDAATASDWALADVVGADSAALVRTHLRRLTLLSKTAVRRYKAYLRELAPLPPATREAALRTNREVFTDPENIRAIRRYTEEGLFPWEK